MQTHDTSENPLAVAFIRRRCRVSEPVARTISELAGFCRSISTDEIDGRLLAQLPRIKREARQ